MRLGKTQLGRVLRAKRSWRYEKDSHVRFCKAPEPQQHKMKNC